MDGSMDVGVGVLDTNTAMLLTWMKFMGTLDDKTQVMR
jgi:hypothetical protein